MKRPSFETLRQIDDLRFTAAGGDAGALTVLEDLLRENYTGTFLARMLEANVAPHRSPEFKLGRAAADREMGQTHPEDIRDYLRQCEEMGCAEGRDEYDRGFMARVRELASPEVG